MLSWIHGKHNLRFGGDYRRVHRDFLAGSNATGSFTFSGLFTEDSTQDQNTGSPMADFLLGLPQSTRLNSSLTRVTCATTLQTPMPRTIGECYRN